MTAPSTARYIAGSRVARDTRVRLIRQERGGVSAARNRGLNEAAHDFVMFLDSDDTIAPTYLERMVGTLAADPVWMPSIAGGHAFCLPARVAGSASGRIGQTCSKFLCLPMPVRHACLRDAAHLALATGGFDTSLTTCEDWDFYQRVTRTGARFALVPECLAEYRIRSGSANRDASRCLADARIVLERGHASDPRVAHPLPVHAGGRDAAYKDLSYYCVATAFAAGEIGAGRDGLALLDADLPPAPDLTASMVGDMLYEFVPIGAGLAEGDWPLLMPQVEAVLAAFLTRLERLSRAPGLAYATMRHLERAILLASDLPPPSASPMACRWIWRKRSGTSNCRSGPTVCCAGFRSGGKPWA